MDFKNDNRHMVDVLFVLTLFFVFALSALTLVILGANVYRTTVDHMDSHFNTRTSYAYISQKLRQSDIDDCIYVSTFGDSPACVMTEEVNGSVFNTYLYEYDGYLYELLTRADMNMEPSAGTKIMEISSLDIEQISDSLYKFKLKTAEDDIVLYFGSHSGTGGSHIYE